MRVTFNVERVEWEELLEDMRDSDKFDMEFIDNTIQAFRSNDNESIIKFFTLIQYRCAEYNSQELQEFNGNNNWLLRIMRLWYDSIQDSNLIFGPAHFSPCIILDSFAQLNESILSDTGAGYFIDNLELCFRQWTYLLRNTTGVKINYGN